MLSYDLDLNGINHEPIFDANEYFEGMFFGNNKTIKNLTVATESNFPSLFGMVMGGFVDQLVRRYTFRWVYYKFRFLSNNIHLQVFRLERDSSAAGFLKTYSGATDKCIIRNCYSLSNIKAHNVFDCLLNNNFRPQYLSNYK